MTSIEKKIVKLFLNINYKYYVYLFLAIKFYLSFFTLYDIIYFIYKTY